MKIILLTGFDAFDGETLNPSWEAVRQLDGERVGDGYRIVACQLPCVFSAALETMASLLETLRPLVVIAVGQAGGSSELRLERIAINIDDARIPDNASQQPIDVPVVADGPAAYFSTLPIKAIRAALGDAGIPASISQSAGTFVCNHVFYGLMHAAGMREDLRRAGFIHIPYLPSQAIRFPGAPSMGLDMIVAGLRIAVQTAMTAETDVRISGGATH